MTDTHTQTHTQTDRQTDTRVRKEDCLCLNTHIHTYIRTHLPTNAPTKKQITWHVIKNTMRIPSFLPLRFSMIAPAIVLTVTLSDKLTTNWLECVYLLTATQTHTHTHTGSITISDSRQIYVETDAAWLAFNRERLSYCYALLKNGVYLLYYMFILICKYRFIVIMWITVGCCEVVVLLSYI